VTIPDEFLQIDTPENVVFGYEVAGVGSRFIAAMIDTIILVVVEVVALVTFGLLLSNSTIFPDEIAEAIGGWIAAIYGLLAFVILWGYYIVFEMLWNGQSPGKRLTRLRVIRSDGTAVTFVEVIVRNLVRLIDFLPLFYGARLITMFIDGKARRLGDMAAGTLVVHTQAEVTLESLTARPRAVTFNAPASLLEEFQTGEAPPPIEKLSEQDFNMIEDYFRRRLDLAQKDILAITIARAISARLGQPTPPATFRDAEQLLTRVLDAHRKATAG
jgi:uncharacterized RDD family membrane protein YckC